MKFKIKGRKFSFIVLGIMIILLLVSMIATRDIRDNLSIPEKAVREAASPISRLVYSVGDFFGEIHTGLSTKIDLQLENDNLHKENNKLKLAVVNGREIEKENQRLKELLHYKDTDLNGWHCVTGKVIGRDIDNWNETLIINKGIADGVKLNMPIVNGDGLLGRVKSVTDNTAEVILLLDKGLSLGVMLEESRTPGIIEGYGGGKDLLKLKYLPYESEITVGETVVSSGKGGIFPKGLRIGRIVKIKVSNNGLSKEAIVEPYADFDRIEEVLIMKQKEK